MKKIMMVVVFLAFVTAFHMTPEQYEYIQEHQYQMQEYGEPVCC